MLFVVTIICMFVSLTYNTDLPNENLDNLLVNNLRRQLMKENHDYDSPNNEIQNIQMRSNTKQNRVENKGLNKTQNITDSGKEVIRSQYINGIISGSSRKVADESNISYDRSDNTYSKPLEHPINVKDLLYYMDEEKILKDKLGPETRNMGSRRNMDTTMTNETEKKYKVLKMKNQFRRKEPRRLIQEEGGDGIVVLSLDDGPLPEFRLPKSRRQYKHERGTAVDEEDELPPPPVDGKEDELKTLKI